MTKPSLYGTLLIAFGACGQISHKDAVEKSELVDRLVAARLVGPSASGESSTTPAVEVVDAPKGPGTSAKDSSFEGIGDLGDANDIPDELLPDGVTKQDVRAQLVKPIETMSTDIAKSVAYAIKTLSVYHQASQHLQKLLM